MKNNFVNVQEPVIVTQLTSPKCRINSVLNGRKNSAGNLHQASLDPRKTFVKQNSMPMGIIVNQFS